MSMKSLLLITALMVTGERLFAVTAADMVGSWQVDTDATWEELKKMPVVTALSADQLNQVKTALIDQMKTAVFDFTPTTLTAQVGGETKKETYVVSKIESDSIFTNDTASDGKVTHSRVDVSPNQLVVTDLDSPSEIVVLKRKTAPAATTPAPSPEKAP